MKKLVLGIAIGAVSIIAMKVNPANAASLSFSVNWVEGEYGTGNLEGFDNNLDGLLTQNELTSFNFVSPLSGYNLNLNDLFSFGSFNLNRGVWNANGAGWRNSTGSYFSWNGGISSVNRSWAQILVTNYVPTSLGSVPTSPGSVPTPPGSVATSPASVPEPASVLGLLAFSALSAASPKRKQQQKVTAKA